MTAIAGCLLNAQADSRPGDANPLKTHHDIHPSPACPLMFTHPSHYLRKHRRLPHHVIFAFSTTV
ncbi:hypothetical protein OQ496_14330, partial [Acetobacter suratthaniensis]